MGNLVWHDLTRLVSTTASVYAIWASFWGILFRKFFWDIMGGIVRNPGGIQPSPKLQAFITIIVKFPVIQIVAMVLGFIMIAIEYPAPFLKASPIHRSISLRVVLLVLQASLTVLFYQGTNACLYSLIAVVFYIRALTLGERIADPKADKRPGQV
ncbi:hypothetical protein JVU11DRAFT_2668 [Chiua virens]|nr:hypothetical protein JVU11DRAFT_2668 [Chiua virens]